MRKKDLLKQNYALFEQLQSANSQLLRLRFEMEELKKKYGLSSEDSQANDSKTASVEETTESKIEEKMVKQEFPSAFQNGFSVIIETEETSGEDADGAQEKNVDEQVPEAETVENEEEPVEETVEPVEIEQEFLSEPPAVETNEMEEIEEIEETETQPQMTVEETVVEEKKTVQLPITKEQEYGAAVIGKIVLESAQCCNRLTSNGDNRHKELVNLILGRAEVAKGEVLDIVSAKVDFSEKQKMMDACCVEALEYFANVMRQKED